MIGLYLESEQDGISLDLLSLADGNPVTALAGLTGFGFPQVEVEFDAGAGDGSVFRSSRVPFRDFDVPLYIQSTSAKDLDDVVNVLARAVRGDVTFRLIDNARDEWILKARHVGGGDFVYGLDNEGEKYVTVTLQFRAGQPFWERVRQSIQVRQPATQQSDFTLDNEGSADAFPYIEATGPFTNLSISGGDRSAITLSGLVDVGETVKIDYEAATVVDQDGASLYSRVGPSPDFSPIPPGQTQLRVNFDNTSQAFRDLYAAPTKNHVRNANYGYPGAGSNTSLRYYHSAFSTSGQANIITGNTSATYALNVVSPLVPAPVGYNYSTFFFPALRQVSGAVAYDRANNDGTLEFYQEVVGLTVGQTYTASCVCWYDVDSFTATSSRPQLRVTSTNNPIFGGAQPNNTIIASTPFTGSAIGGTIQNIAVVSLTFTAPSSAVFIGFGNAAKTVTYAQSGPALFFGNPMVTQGSGYFDQGTVNTAQFTYSTGGDGVVTRSSNASPDISGTRLLVSQKPRRHVML